MVSGTINDARASGTPASYRGWLAGFVTCLSLMLLALVDFRRGFLFGNDYPVRNVFYAFNPWQVVMFLIGIAGMYACFRALKQGEANLADAAQYVKALTFIILVLLVIDLFTYRGVAASRSINSGSINTDWLKAFGITEWWKPIAQATSYLLNVWHATTLGILISGLALTVLPLYLKPYISRTGFSGTMLGALFALPQPFCSCCSSVMAPSLVRRGASINFLLSFMVGAPTLNVTTLILALTLLPIQFALMRIVTGIIVAVAVTYLVAWIANRWGDNTPAISNETQASTGFVQRLLNFYFGLFDLGKMTGNRPVGTPSQLFSTWLYTSGRIALVLVPTLWVWSVIGAALFQLLPTAFGNNILSVVFAAIGGTFFMISTWSEIPMALQMLQAGFNGPAATLLVVLPPISLPCLMLLGGSLRRFRLAAILAVAVIMVGIITGMLFL